MTITLSASAPSVEEWWRGPAGKVPVADALELASKAHLGVWSERKRGLDNSALHWEWSELAMTKSRLCVVAPREHAKTEVFTVNQIAWRCIYTPGIWCYVFAQTGDQAIALKARIDVAIADAAPWMVGGRDVESNKTSSKYTNWSTVTCAGAGKGVRGAHPDLIVGDDVLEEGDCLTSHQRKRTSRWWSGTIGGMAHPGVIRPIGKGESATRVRLPPTKVHLVGTPFHQQDLLLSMKENPMYEFRRYAAEYDPTKCVDGSLAIEIA